MKLSINKKQDFVNNMFLLNPIQDRGGVKKAPPTSFSTVTSRNIGISSQNFLTFSFTLLLHWCKTARPYLVPVPNY